MGDQYPVVKVAAVQAASVFLDREGSTDKACRLIREAGANGAQIIAFPEGFIPAHPVWYHHHPATGMIANQLAIELFKNSVEIPGAQIDALSSAARDANAYVVMGVCEKRPNTLGTMFNSQVWIFKNCYTYTQSNRVFFLRNDRIHGNRFYHYMAAIADINHTF